ncbi:GAF domain-containing sensor histidine kinase [Pedobacter sp. SYSU D00535]|uniref:GAF domain-containing sensor histidine kinase n=1 Tax=Pedobacter sp. SYSU D00535 TaxID=2810308 RepID=UPI001A96B3A3|nr:GAF domain-containing sensor histidine kinase [Pedobacter sp. SYSU D00535]
MSATPVDRVRETELKRLIALSEMDLDFSGLNDVFSDLTILASSITGTQQSVVNLIDTYTQWTVAANNQGPSQCPREESICQYVIESGEDLEVSDLNTDERVRDLSFVKNNPDLKYYYGVPLTTKDGHNVGAFCVLHHETKQLSEEQIALLKIIGNEVVKRLESIRAIADLTKKVAALKHKNKRVAHDIRGPIGGIMGLSEAVVTDEEMPADEVKEIAGLIYDSSKTLLELADEILQENGDNLPVISQRDLAAKLDALFASQAKSKNIGFTVETQPEAELTVFTSTGLLQIIGNLVSNSIKFTQPGGQVKVSLELLNAEQDWKLKIEVSDTGVGMEQERIELIKCGKINSAQGTVGEKGFGLGLNALLHLINQQGGELAVESRVGQGSTFTVNLPIDIR